jgi:hypothetical protein
MKFIRREHAYNREIWLLCKILNLTFSILQVICMIAVCISTTNLWLLFPAIWFFCLLLLLLLSNYSNNALTVSSAASFDSCFLFLFSNEEVCNKSLSFKVDCVLNSSYLTSRSGRGVGLVVLYIKLLLFKLPSGKL